MLYLTISTPHEQGQIRTQLFGFGVADPSPAALPIPLRLPDVLPCDLAISYHEAYENGRWGDIVDYSQAIIARDLATFRADDQAVLEALRQQIIQKHFTP